MSMKCAYDGEVGSATLTPRADQEEGEYEYADDRQEGESNGELRLEPAVLYQPLRESREAATGQPVPLCESDASGDCARDVGGVGDRRGGKRLSKALNHDYPEKGISGCTKGLVAYGALGTVTDILDPPKALAACAIGEVLG